MTDSAFKKWQADVGPVIDKAATLKKWQAAESWIALVQLNREFILQSQAGEDVRTPYHTGPLDEETIELIPGLLRLHEYRLLTVCSQPMENEGPCLDDGRWKEDKQVPFVQFLMPYEGATTEAFISNLINDSQLTTHVYDYRNDTVWPNTVEIEVSMSREFTSYKALPSAEWKILTIVNPHGGETVKAAQDANPLFCSVVTFENINLLERVESHASEAGLERTSFDT